MATMTTLTVEDYKVLPETGPRYQLVEGELRMAPAPNRYHQRIVLNIAFLIQQWVETGGGEGEVNVAPFDVYLDNENVFQPDVLYFSPDNYGVLTDAGCEGAPDLVVEVLSPGTRDIDLGPKKKIYASNGVREMWVVDPDPRTLDVYHLAEDVEKPVAQIGDEDVLVSDVLPGLELCGASIFAE
jgi:Uma2 family endonuclease